MVVLTDPELIREAFTGSNPPVLLRVTSKANAIVCHFIIININLNYYVLH